MDNLENQIIKVLTKHPNGIKAREIARAIPGTDHSDINHVLYGSLKEKCDLNKNTYEWKLKPDWETIVVTHKAPNKKELLNQETAVSVDITDIVCPVCGSPMVKRIARKGSNSGGEFWGCSKYPRCKGTRSIIDDIKTTGKNPVEIKPITAQKPVTIKKATPNRRECSVCELFLNDSCDGQGDASTCPVYKYGL